MPRLCAPISVVLSRQFSFLVQTCIFLVVYGVFLGRGSSWGPTWWVLATPLLVIQLLALATGTGLVLSAATVRYRDIRVLVTFGLQIWMYATPVVYPASHPGRLVWHGGGVSERRLDQRGNDGGHFGAGAVDVPPGTAEVY